MAATKPYILLNNAYTTSGLISGGSKCTTSFYNLSARDHEHRRKWSRERRRAYATIAGDDGHSSNTDHAWPSPPRGQSCPTPYQIFNLPQNAPYSKARFYQLVKIYHPDRSSNDQNASTTQAVKLDRYRLIVAAHTILSDPVKRSAYDRFGAGWAGKADLSQEARSASDQTSHAPGPFSGWRDSSDPNIWANATWEDWERWRVRHDPHSQPGSQSGPVYMSNSSFISIILVLAAVGSSWNYNRADHEGERFLAARDAVHDQASKELRRVRKESGQRAKDERIDWFVRNREANAMKTGMEEIREEKIKRWLPEQEVCLSEDLRSKDEHDQK